MPTFNDGTAVSAPSAAAMQCSYTTFSEEVGDYLGIGRDSWSALEQTRIDSIIKSGLRQVYYPQEFKPGITHQWSFLRPEAEITTTAAYSTGTVEIALGITTLTTGTWPSWAAEGELHVDGQVYNVDTRNSSQQITLNDLTVVVAAGSTYSLRHPSYDLPSGFGGSFDGDLHYKSSENNLWPPIRFVSPAVIRMKKQIYNGTDRPLFASIQPNTFDATVGQRWRITFFPAPNAVFIFYGRYKLTPSMIDGSDLYPLGGPAMCETFLESCLAVAEKRFVEDTTIHQEEFQRLLLQAIAHDADVHSADFLGYNSDRSEYMNRRDGLDRRYDDAIHTFEGTAYYD